MHETYFDMRSIHNSTMNNPNVFIYESTTTTCRQINNDDKEKNNETQNEEHYEYVSAIRILKSKTYDGRETAETTEKYGETTYRRRIKVLQKHLYCCQSVTRCTSCNNKLLIR